MSSFEETFKGLLLEFLKRRGIEAVEVTGYGEDAYVYNSGGCPSCAFDEKEYSVDIFYTPNNEMQWGSVYTYSGKFSDLLAELFELADEGAE